MNKIIWISAVVLSVAACAKNEVVPVNSGENQEITFNVAPKTKGTVPSTDPSYTVPSTDPRYFNENNHFVSYAYFRGEGNQWPGTVGQIYIDAADISFTDNKWKEAGSTYYWPKSDKSSLTFFAWSTNSTSITLAGDAEVSCDSKSGISVSGYDVTKNENVDLLVADVAANKNANEDIYSHNGVPTLFRHKLSYLIFKVKTATNYASAGKEFALKSIKILGVDARGTYSQNATATNSDDSYNTVGSWEVTDSKAAQKANTTTTGEAGKYYTDGVPTLFRHRLSYLAFNVKTDKDYSAAGKKLELKSITFNNISSYGEYRQFATEISGATFPSGFRAADATGTVSYTRIPTTESPFTMEIKSSNTGSGVLVSDTDNFLYIPQTFAKGSKTDKNAYIEVKYTIATKVGKDEHDQDIVVTENVTKQIFLNPEDGKGTKMFDKWEMGKKYTINLTFTLDEILWDPAVEDWEDVTPATDHIVE